MAQAESLANPFVAGSPLTRPEMFFGREDVFEFINNALVGQHQDNIIVLYGKRRTGKTSVLYQMRRHIDSRYLPVLIDLQGLTMDGMAGFFYELSAVIGRALRRDYDIDLPRLHREDFLEDPLQTFQINFLTDVLDALGDRHLLLMIDEVSRLQEQVEAGKLPPDVFGQIRSLLQHSPRLNFIFAIGERLAVMQTQYAVLFSVALYKEISFLSRSAAIDLIQSPTRGLYALDPTAINLILEVTSGHPYFIQLLCHGLFAHWQRDKKLQLTANDVNQVMEEVVERGSAVLKFEWDELATPEKLMLSAMAHMMGHARDSVSLSNIRDVLGAFDIDVLPGDLATAQRNLINAELISGETLRFTVDFMRLWVQEHEKLEWVKGELAGSIEELRHAAEAARAEVAARRKPARIGGMVVAGAVAAIGVVSLALAIISGGGPTPPEVVNDFQINQCTAHAPPAAEGLYTIEWCVITAVLFNNQEVRLNASWHAAKSPDLSPGLSQLADQRPVVKAALSPNDALFLEDINGNRYQAIDLGDAAAEEIPMRDQQQVLGWFRFPPLPTDKTYTFVFPEDNIRIQNIRFQ